MRLQSHWKISLFWLLGFLGGAFLSSASQALELDSFPGGLVPGTEILIYEDAGAELSFEQARAQLASVGQPWVAPGHPNLGYRRSALWVRADLDNRFTDTRDWVAYIGFPNLDRVDFYYQDSTGDWHSHAAGSALPFRARHLMHRSINFEFPVPASQPMSLYFRVESAGSLQFPLSLASTAFFASEAQRTLFVSGLYFGLMLMIVIYSVTVWYTSRENGFLYFALVVVFGSLYSLTAQGLAYQYLWPEAPVWANRAKGVFSMMACVAGILFVRAFLGLRQLDIRLDAAARIFAVVTGIGVIVGFMVDPALVNRMALACTFVLMVIMTISGLLARRRHLRAATFFITAWTILLAGILLELVQRLGVIIPPLLAYNGIQVAGLVAVTVLALGLSDRVQGMMEGYKSAQQDLLKANQLKIDALQQADNVKEEFIANVSHELRTPLTGIIGLAEIMLDDQTSNLDSPQRETLTLMKVSAQRLASLVNDVIDFSAVKNGHLALNKKDVDLKQVCRLVVRMTQPLIGDKPVKLVESYPSGRIVVEGDEDRLQQVLFNLVANAVKFTPHGAVTVAVEVLEIDVRVSVRDTGIGISAAEQKHIFQRFYQVDSDEARQTGGTGLGLSISQRLLELHGSEIVLRGAPGEGSLFYFDLPLKSSWPEHKKNGKGTVEFQADKAAGVASRPVGLAAALQATGLNVDRRKGGRETEAGTDPDTGPAVEEGRRSDDRQGRILVVDDEYLNLRIVESHLADRYHLTTALSGAEALEKLGKNKPDLIVLDLMMPVMTGYQFCQIVRKRYDQNELPIVILTAKNRVEDLVKGLSLGANDYITKPFSKEELRVRIDKQFELLKLQHLKRDNQRLHWQMQRYEENEKRLREREQRLAALLDVTGDPLMAIDEAGVVIFVNNPAETLLQVPASECLQQSVNRVSERLMPRSPALAGALHFPFEESVISCPGNTEYFDFQLESVKGRFCVLTLSQLDQEFYLLVFECTTVSEAAAQGAPAALSLPQIIEEINRNVERTQILGEYLTHIKPEDLHKHKELVDELGSLDQFISRLSGAVTPSDEDDGELRYREALVKVMQDCHFYWQKVTCESIIDLAEKSRIWSVSIDNGRLRTRSMNRYLSLDKLPSNPRWRQVARTAYFVLSKVSHDEEARKSLENSVTRLQEIVEQKALN